MRVLQIGHEDWSESCRLPDDVEWSFVDTDDASAFDPDLIGHIDVTILDAPCQPEHLAAIDSLITPYALIVAREHGDGFDDSYATFFARKAAVFESQQDRQRLVDGLPRKYFTRQFGQKLEIRTALVSPLNSSESSFDGNSYLVTNTDHQDDFRQMVIWRENILYEKDQPLELWPEYVKEPTCEIQLRVQLIESEQSAEIICQKRYSEGELSDPVVFSEPTSGYLSCSVFAKGTGQVKVGPIHYRHSRLGAGQFLPGGKRIVDSRREELFYYFHPGNLKPPLNIYFAGYRPAEGFEGYFMMAGLEHPFILISDPRLEGGRFYLGSDELENGLVEMIREHIDRLGFTEQDVIFSGLSMGSFAALYYGSQFDALAIIASKPIVDLGYVAERGRLVRPDEFFTIFDIVNFWDRHADTKTVEAFTEDLIGRWKGASGFGNTKILMSYMLNDDYDDKAYFTLVKSQAGKLTPVIGRGYQGRHNDDSTSIVTWFSDQYRRVIDEYQATHA